MNERQAQIEKAKSVEELWQTTGQGTIYVNVTNLEGRTVDTGVGGRPGALLRITTYDRMRNQETCVEPSMDPFTNGMLVRIDTDQNADDEGPHSPNALTQEQIIEIFALGKSDFRERIEDLSEYNVRRMLEMAEEVDATKSQIDQLREVLEAKWPIGGHMPIYEELAALGQTAVQDR